MTRFGAYGRTSVRPSRTNTEHCERTSPVAAKDYRSERWTLCLPALPLPAAPREPRSLTPPIVAIISTLTRVEPSTCDRRNLQALGALADYSTTSDYGCARADASMTPSPLSLTNLCFIVDFWLFVLIPHHTSTHFGARMRASFHVFLSGNNSFHTNIW